MKKASAGESSCANCGAPGTNDLTLKLCSRCKLVSYCGKDCQVQHWKDHKKFCISPEDRTLKAANEVAVVIPEGIQCLNVPISAESVDCAICLEEMQQVAACLLPCGHIFHVGCISSLRSFGVRGESSVCPLCRAALPVGRERELADSFQRFAAIERELARGRSLWGDEITDAWRDASRAQQQALEECLALWRGAAAEGHPGCMAFLGFVHQYGIGVPKRLSEAARWYTPAADKGFAEAQFGLAQLVEYGEGGLKSDMKQALALYEAAAKQGHAKAQFSFGRILQEGTGGGSRRGEGLGWVVKSANQGYAEAQFNYGCQLVEQGMRRGDRAGGVREAEPWLRRAAAQGIEPAMQLLGPREAKEKKKGKNGR